MENEIMEMETVDLVPVENTSIEAVEDCGLSDSKGAFMLLGAGIVVGGVLVYKFAVKPTKRIIKGFIDKGKTLFKTTKEDYVEITDEVDGEVLVIDDFKVVEPKDKK